MAIQNGTQLISPNSDGSIIIITWAVMANGDTGSPIELVEYESRTTQITGTFGVAGSVSWEGSNDGANWFVLTKPGATAATFTAAGIAALVELPRYVRPHVTAGDGTTALVASAVLRRASSMHQ